VTDSHTNPAASDEAENGAMEAAEEISCADTTGAGGDELAGSDESADDKAGRRGERHRVSRGRVVAFAVMPLLLMLMAIGAGYLKYQGDSVRTAQAARISSVQAATESTIALLSYTPDTAQAKLTAARDLLTGPFRDSYTSLTNDVVIPGSKQKQISATATVPAASSVSASENHAVVLVFVDQSLTVGSDAPTTTASAVQVTLDRAGNRWLISGFDPK
jgi:Mce-associated membrane protein